MTMTWEQALEAIERMESERQAQDAARRALITPHVRRAPKKKPQRMSGPRYFNLMRAIENHPEEYADYRPTNYCGAPLTTEDWDKRSALAKKNAGLVADAEVCADCLRLSADADTCWCDGPDCGQTPCVEARP